jgi:putative isomerase
MTTSASAYMSLLRNSIDITRVPFSDRGSRLMVFQVPQRSHLFIKLAERLTELQPDIEAYLRRPPIISDLCLVDESGDEIEFEVETSCHTLYLRTRLGEFGLAFHDRRTIALGLPPGVVAGVRFRVAPQHWEQSDQGGAFRAVRNVAYASNGLTVRNEITPEAGSYKVDLVVQAAHNNTVLLAVGAATELPHKFEVLPFSEISATSESRWREWFSCVPPVTDIYQRTYAYAWWVMANNLISAGGKVAYEAMTPSKTSYVGLWLWDNAMHSLAFRYVNPDLARNQIRAMLACQLPDGMLPDAVYDEGVISEIGHPFTSEVTKPPILAWAALKLHETAPDLGFLQEIYVPLVRWNAWWFSMNDDDVDGLAQYNHPFSSGLDDSPLWDYGMPVESPDLNTYLCVQMRSLALMAEALGMPSAAAMWSRRSAAIVRRMLEDMWDDEAGLFWVLREEQPVRVVTPFNLYPLWTGHLSDHVRDRLIGHLTDPAKFWGEFVIPTVARDDAHYDPERMWRGPVWANINYFFIEALDRAGRHDLAIDLRDRTLALVMSQPGMYEYYNAETGVPPEAAAGTFGWTASVFIDLAIQASQLEEPEQMGTDQ